MKAKPLLPREVDQKLVPPAWKKAVFSSPDLPTGAVDRTPASARLAGVTATCPEAVTRLIRATTVRKPWLPNHI
ncbi:hypothetical protein ACTVZO_42430 [Streptomyces sp. IBSNAI002]|uniref:hypothetical protein n=1 Tax=Streptomyces sp. IBSNAI002 TaxID=3457500 RepID=UPI003FD29EC8